MKSRIINKRKKNLKKEWEIKYPLTKKIDLTENIHKTFVSDPYRWLEEVESEEVQKWAVRQDELTRKFLRDGSEFENIYKGLK